MRFIQVGVGGFGRRWVDVLKNNLDAQVVGMVDISQDALTTACEVGGYDASICFKSLDEALEAVTADALVCCTPPEHHKAPVIQALANDMHVISEKPMAESMESCREMLAATANAGQTYVVSQNYRYSPATWTMAQLVKQGAIGTIGQVKVDFYKGHDFHGGFRHVMAYPLIVDMSIHHVDLMRFITGLDPVTVRGTAWNPPWSNYQGDCSSSLVYTMNNGARVVYNGSWCAKGQFSDWNGNWLIEGDKGTLQYSNGVLKLLKVPTVYTVDSEETVVQKAPAKQGQDYVLDDFIHAIGTGQRAATDVYDNIHSVGMVFAAVEALESGEEITVLDPETQQLLEKVAK